MRLLIIFALFMISSSASGRTQMWTITGNVPLPATSYDSVTLCYVYPGERILAETVSYYRHEYATIHKQDGNSGLVLKSQLQPATDSALFRFNYPEYLFPFYSDTSAYAKAGSLSCGWGGIAWWTRYAAENDPSDTFNVAAWTRRAYLGDTTAMLTLLGMGYGDIDAAGQFDFNKWKLINHWSDSALAELLLSNWLVSGRGPFNYLMLDIEAPFGQDILRDYYRMYYPLCYSMIVRNEERVGDLSKKEVRRFRRMMRKHSARY